MPTVPPADATPISAPRATRSPRVARVVGERERIEKLERRAARLSAVANVQRAITAAVTLDELASEIYTAVASVVDAPCFALFLFDDAARVFVPLFVVNDGVRVPTDALPRLPLGDGATSQAFRTCTPNVTGRSHQGWTGRSHEIAGSNQIAVMVSAPIVDGESALGVLQAQSYRLDAYDWDDVDIVMHVARQAGTALVRARMFEAERRARQEAEAAFHREHLLAAALDTLDQPVFICTARSVIRYANGAAVREYGYPAERFAGLRARELSVHAGDQIDATGVHQAMLQTGQWSGELAQRRADGSVFPAHVHMNEIRDGDTPIGIVVSVRNLTEERRIAEQLRQSDKMAALGELVAGVAHEVNNPLASISAFAQLLQDAPLSTEHREAVQIIKQESERATAVVRDLLMFARKTGPRSVHVDLAVLLDQTLRLRTYSLRMAGVKVERVYDSELQRVYGDDRQLQQVFLNLIVNAEHAMASVSRRVLTVRAFPQDEGVIIEVADTGAGMTPDVQQRIFEPFFTTKGEGKGTGLGLSVSYGIVESHGGTITVRSGPGSGTTFRIALPLDRRRITRETA